MSRQSSGGGGGGLFLEGLSATQCIGLSDRTSVALDPPLAHLGQAFLSVSRHRPPSHDISLSFSLSLSLAMMVGPLWVWVVHRSVCVHVCVFRCERQALELDSERSQRPDSVAGKEQVRAL